MTKTVLVTGADGFLGRNLIQHLKNKPEFCVREVGRRTSNQELRKSVRGCDAVVHLAGVNRSSQVSEFESVNVRFTKELLEVLENHGTPPIFFASSTQAIIDSPYGRSKKDAELIISAYGNRNGVTARIARLPNVFGKWSRPNYNSVVATFAFNIIRNLPIRVDNPDEVLEILYVDDLVRAIIHDLSRGFTDPSFKLNPIYRITVGDLAKTLIEMHRKRRSGAVLEVGEGIHRALYATYVSFLEPSSFSYPLDQHKDERGLFVEFIKTVSSGQVSFFTAKPGVTRGSHFHHTKVEKFIVTHGAARFQFQNLLDGTIHYVDVSADTPVVVESVPGWIHSVTNLGNEDLSVLVWASEVFNPHKTDTFGEVIEH